MKNLFLYSVLLGFSCILSAQFDPSIGKGIRWPLNQDGSHYLHFTMTNQIWMRYNESNPGSTVEGSIKKNTFDIGIRRSRIQLYGSLNKRSFVYVQIGVNNINHLSDRKQGLFFHDAISEFSVIQDKLSVGAGITNWVGLSRLSNASIITFLPLDSPIFPFATIDATDQFNRKLSLYFKGKLGKLDYRLALTDPMDIEKSTIYDPKEPIGMNSNFAAGAHHKQYQGYFMWQFFDQESNLTPYLAGTYLGTKKVLNLGAGFVRQRDAMWRKTSSGDTLKSDLNLIAIDAFADLPLNKDKGNALTAYAGLFFNDYGKGYLRNNGIMNPANGTAKNLESFNGAGNAFPLFGTGKVFYTQIGYLFGNNFISAEKIRIQPYFAYMLGDYDRLEKSLHVTNAGVNFFLNYHNAKVSLDWQQRPIYAKEPVNSNLRSTGRKNCMIIQFQVAI